MPVKVAGTRATRCAFVKVCQRRSAGGFRSLTISALPVRFLVLPGQCGTGLTSLATTCLGLAPILSTTSRMPGSITTLPRFALQQRWGLILLQARPVAPHSLLVIPRMARRPAITSLSLVRQPLAVFPLRVLTRQRPSTSRSSMPTRTLSSLIQRLVVLLLAAVLLLLPNTTSRPGLTTPTLPVAGGEVTGVILAGVSQATSIQVSQAPCGSGTRTTTARTSYLASAVERSITGTQVACLRISPIAVYA